MNTKVILTNRQIRKMLFAVVTAFISATTVTAQTYTGGQHVEPAFEGWRPNPDGSFNMMFGYMNENWEETPDVAVGEENFATVSLLRLQSLQIGVIANWSGL
jgi:hypothetical protein